MSPPSSDTAGGVTGGVGLMWFRRDLRLNDNPAWSAATSAHAEVVALYVLDDRQLDAAGPFRRRQLLADLRALDSDLRDRGGRLLVRRGDPVDVVPTEAARLDASGVHWNADVGPGARRRDDAVRASLAVGPLTPFGHLVLPPGSVTTATGHVHRVFSAFHRAWLATTWDDWPTPGGAAVADETGDPLPASDGPPPRDPGEEGARQALQRFLGDAVARYRAGRDSLAEAATSDLSVHLKFGTISARQVVDAVRPETQSHAVMRQLAWRDWFAHLLFERPDLTRRAMRPEHRDVRWRDDPDGLAAWCEGRTGYPVVDAAMRELAATGSMHNRARMVAASFLVKDLLIDWRLGEAHFRRLLADADVSQNVGNWQWVAGTGPDAVPYFRVLNPVTQSRTHDPSGAYLRRWLPELRGLDDTAVHSPWRAGPAALAAAGVTLGDTYPHPIVDHDLARARALGAFRQARAAGAARAAPSEAVDA